jgi:hypothetical protein
LALQSKYAIVQSEKADLKRASAKLSKQLESLRTDLDRFNKEAVQVINLILSCFVDPGYGAFLTPRYGIRYG